MCGWMDIHYNYYISMLSYTHIYSGAINFRIKRGLNSSQAGELSVAYMNAGTFYRAIGLRKGNRKG